MMVFAIECSIPLSIKMAEKTDETLKKSVNVGSHLSFSGAVQPSICNMLTFLTDESKQVKQLSKNSINMLWSLSKIKSHRQTLKYAITLTVGMATSNASLDMPKNSCK